MKNVVLFVDSFRVLTKILNYTQQVSGFLWRNLSFWILKKKREKVTIHSCFNASGIH